MKIVLSTLVSDRSVALQTILAYSFIIVKTYCQTNVQANKSNERSIDKDIVGA